MLQPVSARQTPHQTVTKRTSTTISIGNNWSIAINVLLTFILLSGCLYFVPALFTNRRCIYEQNFFRKGRSILCRKHIFIRYKCWLSVYISQWKPLKWTEFALIIAKEKKKLSSIVMTAFYRSRHATQISWVAMLTCKSMPMELKTNWKTANNMTAKLSAKVATHQTKWLINEHYKLNYHYRGSRESGDNVFVSASAKRPRWPKFLVRGVHICSELFSDSLTYWLTYWLRFLFLAG
jgi:hypothetical protein